MAIGCQPEGAEWGATGGLGGLRVGESLRAPQGTRHQPARRGAPLPREPPLADSKRTSPCTGSAAHVALPLRAHRGRHRRAPPRCSGSISYTARRDNTAAAGADYEITASPAGRPFGDNEGTLHDNSAITTSSGTTS